jgi:branched-chain amino acid transport system substrate-binding protein
MEVNYMVFSRVFKTAIISGALLSLSAITALAADEIKIGAVVPLSGSVATYGQSVNTGIKMALDEFNAAGGIKGKKVSLIVADDKGDPSEATNAFNKLIVNDKVTAIIGAVTSGNSQAAAPIAQSMKIPMISPSSTNEKVTQVGDYIFRVCFIDPYQGEVMAQFASKKLKLKKIATLVAVTGDYSIGLNKYFTKTFKSLGGTITTEQSYSEGDQDFNAQLTKIKASKPQAIYIPGYYTDVALIARQARQLGITVPILGGDGYDSPKFHELGGDAVAGSYFTNHYSPNDTTATAAGFIKKYQAKYKTLPDAFTALGYDAAKLLLNTVKKVGKADPKAIRDTLAKTKKWEGVTGTLSFDNNRNPIKTLVILKQEKDGKTTFVTKM